MNLRSSAKIVSLVLVSIIISSCQFLRKAETAYIILSGTDAAVRLVKQKRYELAIEKCNEVIQTKPKDGLIYLVRAEAYSGLGDYQKAVDDCTEAIKHNPDIYSGSGRYLRSKVYQKCGQERLAAQDFVATMKDRIKWRSKYISELEQEKRGVYGLTEYYNERAAAYACLGQFQKAIEDCNKAESIASSKDDAKGSKIDAVYINRAFAYMGIKRYKDAVNDLNKAISLDPKNEEPYYWRAKAYMKLGLSAKAVNDMNESKSLDSKMTDESSLLDSHFEDRIFASKQLEQNAYK